MPADAFFGIHTVRAVENFRISPNTISDMPDLIRGLVQVKKAVMLANGDLGVVDPDVVNEVLANLALEHLGCAKGSYDTINPLDHDNRSQSTNDAYPTGLRLALDTRLGDGDRGGTAGRSPAHQRS